MSWDSNTGSLTPQRALSTQSGRRDLVPGSSRSLAAWSVTSGRSSQDPARLPACAVLSLILHPSCLRQPVRPKPLLLSARDEVSWTNKSCPLALASGLDGLFTSPQPRLFPREQKGSSQSCSRPRRAGGGPPHSLTRVCERVSVVPPHTRLWKASGAGWQPWVAAGWASWTCPPLPSLAS